MPDLRVRTVGTRVCEEEYQALEKLAAARGQTLASGTRQLVLAQLNPTVATPSEETVIAEVLALREILLNILFRVANQEKLTAEGWWAPLGADVFCVLLMALGAWLDYVLGAFGNMGSCGRCRCSASLHATRPLLASSFSLRRQSKPLTGICYARLFNTILCGSRILSDMESRSSGGSTAPRGCPGKALTYTHGCCAAYWNGGQSIGGHQAALSSDAGRYPREVK